MSIPADYRRVLDECDKDRPSGKTTRMYLMHGAHLRDHLEAYTPQAMEAIIASVGRLPRGSRKRKMASRYIMGKCVEIEIDKDGRIVMPKERREQIGLGDSGGVITFVGMGEYFEVWNKEVYDVVEAELDASYLEGDDEDEDVFDPMSLLPEETGE